ncbi:hypothetical protein BD324DRAFT_656327 [Kockovaella imperatae]|uniref:Uncharacterized protein n=1 Tax=Kockovaella imperatae TaxID=4999 RepID=A0A1Y1UI36_9TREE|nr:hypothetical protein BD324DRAFT_656327 [Kockovaella imperatae]ORX37144.1 hypothetical protein BD324DRAFT_656327 [Kockovaella imperatae]
MKQALSSPQYFKARVSLQFVPDYPAYLAKAPKSISLPANPPPALPFHKDTAHTIPTKWGLYRSLLRDCRQHDQPAKSSEPSLVPAQLDQTPGAGPSRSHKPLRWPHIHEMVQTDWRNSRHVLSIAQARQFLTYYYQILSDLRSSSPESLARLAAIEESAQRTMIMHRLDVKDAEAEREALKASRRKQWGKMTGGFLYPNAFMPPMPKLRPQPEWIAGTYRSRMKKKEKSIKAMRDAEEARDDILEEIQFLSRLERLDSKVWRLEGSGGWLESYRKTKEAGEAMQRAGAARANATFTEETVKKVLEARKARHKTYMAFAWQRKEEKEARIEARKEERANFYNNKQRAEEMKIERWMREDKSIGRGKNLFEASDQYIYWDEANGGGYVMTRKWKPTTSYGIKKQTLAEAKEDLKQRQEKELPIGLAGSPGSGRTVAEASSSQLV